MKSKLVELTHIGNGVVIVCPSGARYEVAPGETIAFLPIDAKGLTDHPEWTAAVNEEPSVKEPSDQDDPVQKGEEK